MTRLARILGPRILGVLSGVVLALMAPSTGRAEGVVVGQGITIGWAPFFVAERLDLWKQNGLDAKVVSFPSGRLVIESILGGSATFGTATETPVVLSALNNLPIRILAVFDTHEVYDLVATTDIRSIEDIRGKRVGYSGGTNAQVYLGRLLDRAGLKPTDIQAVSLNPPEMVTALANGSIDGFVWSEPHQSQALALKPEAFHRIRVPGLYTQYSTIVTTQQAIETRRSELVAALRALISAVDYIDRQPEASVRITALRIKMDPKLAGEIWPQIRFAVMLDRTRLIEELRKQAQWAIDSGIARPGAGLPDFDAVVVGDLLDEARRAPPNN